MNEREAAIDRYLNDRTLENRDAVIVAHLYLCRRGARKFRRTGSDACDLEQVAAIGLLKAATTYRRERTTPFEAYAWLLIVGELMHYVRDSERLVRIPRALRALDRRYVSVWEAVAADEQAEPGTQRIARALGVPIATVDALQALHAPVTESPRPAADAFDTVIVAPCGVSVEDRLTLRMAVEALSEREQIIVLGTFAAGLSQLEVARRLGLSQSQVSKLLSKALVKLAPKVA